MSSAVTRSPFGTVVVVDELGFHQATSVAELLADRGCRVEIVTNGMVVAQDLGITLDMENWWIRASAKGIVQIDRSRAHGVRWSDASAPAPPDRRDAGSLPGLGGAVHPGGTSGVVVLRV